MQQLAGRVADSFLFSRGRRLSELNSQNWLLPLSKLEKLLCGGYLILKDYSEGKFPPRFDDQARTYQGETNYHNSLPGLSAEQVEAGEMRKPFWDADTLAKYLSSFQRLLKVFEELGIRPKSRLLELGCGHGWMAEFFALCGYSVVGSSLVPREIQMANRRVASLQAKGVPFDLSFIEAPMESIDRCVADGLAFDCVYVFEALHHAFDWRLTIAAAYRCLRPGGWLVIANEPNRLHTYISYRVGRISNTHEVGLKRSELIEALKASGFLRMRVIQPRLDNFVTAHWIAARR